MPDSGWIEFIIKILEYIFGKPLPVWLSVIITALLFMAVLVAFVYLFSKLIILFQDSIWPRFTRPTERRRIRRRRNFARNLKNRIIDLNTREDWTDYHFTELEAEVEVEGRLRPVLSWLRILPSWNSKRRVRSLTRALEISDDRITLLEGDPGSGKSVALRHLAISMLERAEKSGSTRGKFPLYVNLKELRRQRGQNIDSDLIENFVCEYLTANNNRDDEEYLDEEFETGKENGSWVFIFDSFDEIPDILSATEANEVIRQYTHAIDEFLHGQNCCRGIIASRQFRGPRHDTMPRIVITPLTEKRKRRLIHQANLEPKDEKRLVNQLYTANQDIQNLAANPMFLGLICQHIHQGYNIPQDAHILFETYISNRLKKDEERVKKHYGLSIQVIRKTAENLAFCMTAQAGLGLGPTRLELEQGMAEQGFGGNHDLPKILDALEFIKLARYGMADKSQKELGRTFSFAHRRFQEFLATCVVLRERNRIPERELLLNARWRETAVVLCQTQPIQTLLPLIQTIRQVLDEMAGAISAQHQLSMEALLTRDEKREPARFPFNWPAGCHHVLGILQEGFSNRLNDLPADISEKSGWIILLAYKMGGLFDRRWALEVIGSAPEAVRIHMMERAVTTSSDYLHEIVYQQLGRVGKLSPALKDWIRISIVFQSVQGELVKNWQQTKVLLSRIDHSEQFLNSARLLRLAQSLDLVVIIVFAFPNLLYLMTPGWSLAFINITLTILVYTTVWKAWYLARLTLEAKINVVVFTIVFASLLRIYLSAFFTMMIFAFLGYKSLNIFGPEIVRGVVVNSFFVLLGIASIFSCLDGVFSRSPLLWILVPFSPISLIITRVPKMYRFLIASVSSLKKYPVMAISFSTIVVVFLVVIYLGVSNTPHSTPQEPEGLVYFGWGLLVFAVFTVACIINQFIKWQRFKKNLKPMSFNDLLAVLLKPQFGRSKILRQIWRNNLIIANARSEYLLTYFILLVENSIKAREAHNQASMQSSSFKTVFTSGPYPKKIGDFDLERVPADFQTEASEMVSTAQNHVHDFYNLCSNENMDLLGRILERVRAQREA